MANSSYFLTNSLRNIFGDKNRGLDLKYRSYRFKWIFAPKYHYVTKFPTHLDIEVTNNCNLRCVMCPINFMEGTKEHMDYDLYKKIIDEGSQYGLNSIKFNWRGEPLLHQKIIEMVKYAKNKGVIDVQFNTNAQLLTEETSAKLIDAGLDRIIFSVDGASEEVYEKIRRGGKYGRLVKNVENFARIRKEKGTTKPFTRIQFVKMKENLSDVDKFTKKWTGVIDEVCVNPYLNPLGQSEDERSTEKLNIIRRQPCNQLWQRLTISWDGKVMMCCGDWEMKVVLGDANTDSIYKIWHSKRLNTIRKVHRNLKLEKIPVCTKCPVMDSYKIKK
jgi:radical SAM protein with 4Fe4S-binding SPASM domain